MTAAQLSRLRTLAKQARDPEAFDETLTQAEAAKRIAALQIKVAREREAGVIRFPKT